MQELSTRSLHHSSDQQSESHLIVDDLHHMFVENLNSFDLQSRQNKSLSSHSFDKCSLNAVLAVLILVQIRITSYLNATISSVCKTTEFEIFRSTHVRENLSRQFSISILATSSFSILDTLQLSSVLEHRQEHSVIRWSDSWIISNVSRVENEWRSLLWERLIWRSLKSSLFSNLSLVILLLWRSHYFEKVLECVVLFLLSSLALSLIWGKHQIVIFEKFSMLLFCSSLILLTFYLVLLWKSHWSEETKSCCFLLFYWFVEKWLFFFVVASSWSSTITHLLSTLCDSLSNDKYERKRGKKKNQTWQYSFEEAYCTVRWRETDA